MPSTPPPHADPARAHEHAPEPAQPHHGPPDKHPQPLATSRRDTPPLSPQRHRWARILTWVDISLATIAQRLSAELEAHHALARQNPGNPPILAPQEQAYATQIARSCREAMTYSDRLGHSLSPQHHEQQP